MKKQNILIPEIIDLQQFALKKGFRIRSIEVMDFWYEPDEEPVPYTILGIDIVEGKRTHSL